MKVIQLLFVGYLLIILGGCSDLLGSEELVAELEKNQDDIHCSSQPIDERPDSCHPIFVVDGKVIPQGGGSSLRSFFNPHDIVNIEVIKDSSNVPLSISSSENYIWKDKFRGIVLITTKN